MVENSCDACDGFGAAYSDRYLLPTSPDVYLEVREFHYSCDLLAALAPIQAIAAPVPMEVRT